MELCLHCVRHELPTNVELFLWYMCASGLGCLMAGLLGVHRLVLDDVHLMALAIVAYLFVHKQKMCPQYAPHRALHHICDLSNSALIIKIKS